MKSLNRSPKKKWIFVDKTLKLRNITRSGVRPQEDIIACYAGGNMPGNVRVQDGWRRGIVVGCLFSLKDANNYEDILL